MLNVSEFLGGCARTDELTGEVLYDMVRKILPQIVVEIGTGNSTRCLAKALSDIHMGHLYTIDPSNIGKEVMRDLVTKGLDKRVTFIQKYSDHCGREFRDKHINLLFIDGNHYYNSVMTDWKVFTPYMKKGDVVIFHDMNEVEVTKAFNELCSQGSEYYIEQDPPQPGIYTTSIGVIIL